MSNEENTECYFLVCEFEGIPSLKTRCKDPHHEPITFLDKVVPFILVLFYV